MENYQCLFPLYVLGGRKLCWKDTKDAGVIGIIGFSNFLQFIS